MYIYIYIYIYMYIVLLQSIVIRRDSGLSTLCHNGGFACQQRRLKTLLFPISSLRMG